jgi:uncharacterized protein YcbK (DUF882 family)
MKDVDVSRRRFLASAAAFAPVLLFRPHALVGETTGPGDAAREIALEHLHTGEELDVIYWSAGEYVHESLSAVDHVLRDWRTGGVHRIDPALLDLLHDLQKETGTAAPFEVICGYRSPETNAMLRRTSSGVASASLHMVGKAIDIRLPGVPLARLRDTALGLRRGGVGYYPSSDFVHVDTGRFRTW